MSEDADARHRRLAAPSRGSSGESALASGRLVEIEQYVLIHNVLCTIRSLKLLKRLLLLIQQEHVHDFKAACLDALLDDVKDPSIRVIKFDCRPTARFENPEHLRERGRHSGSVVFNVFEDSVVKLALLLGASVEHQFFTLISRIAKARMPQRAYSRQSKRCSHRMEDR